MVDNDVGEPTDKDLKQSDDFVRDEEGYIYSKTGLTREEIVSTSLLFFMAGFDTVTAALSFLCYNLACNQDKQEKLYQEIVDVLGDKDPDYDMLKKMPYLQMCVDESLRLFPPAQKTDRVCNQDITINGFKFEKDMLVGIPTWCIHHNPEIYPDPYEFIPERMSPEQKAA